MVYRLVENTLLIASSRQWSFVVVILYCLLLGSFENRTLNDYRSLPSVYTGYPSSIVTVSM